MNKLINKKKIVVIAEFEYFGGAKTYFFLLINFLFELNYKIIVYIQNIDNLTKDEYLLLIKKVEVKNLPKSLLYKSKIVNLLKLNKFFIYLFFLYIKLFFNYNKLIISATSPLKFISASILNKNKLIYILHTYPNGVDFSRKLKWQEILRNYFFYSDTFTFVTVSNASKSVILNYLKINDNRFKIDVIGNPSSFINSEKHHFQKKIVLTLGHVEHYKNPFFWVEVAIEITKKNKDVYFYWLGDGSLLESAKNMIPNSLSQNICFFGHKNYVLDFYNECWLYFQPSIIESNGISVIDAMSLAIPSIVSNIGGLPELIDNNKTGYVVPLNKNIVISKISNLLTNKQLSIKMGNAALQKYITTFSLDIWKNKMQLVINK